MKRKTIIRIVGVVALLGAIGVAVCYKMWTQPHRDITSEEADFKVTAAALAGEFGANAAGAEKKYSEKVLEITGEVQKVTPGDSLTVVQLKGDAGYGLLCEMLPGEKDVAGKAPVGKTVKMKAFYKGYMEGEVEFEMPGDILFKKGVITE